MRLLKPVSRGHTFTKVFCIQVMLKIAVLVHNEVTREHFYSVEFVSNLVSNQDEVDGTTKITCLKTKINKRKKYFFFLNIEINKQITRNK